MPQLPQRTFSDAEHRALWGLLDGDFALWELVDIFSGDLEAAKAVARALVLDGYAFIAAVGPPDFIQPQEELAESAALKAIGDNDAWVRWTDSPRDTVFRIFQTNKGYHAAHLLGPPTTPGGS